MTRYDLREFKDVPWVRHMAWFRAGFGVTVLAVGAIIFYYDIEALILTRNLPSAEVALFAALALVWLLFAWLLLRLGPAASFLVVDDDGLRLEYGRGGLDLRRWSDPNFVTRGRRTGGVGDSISRGLAVQSIFGPHGGSQETFVPSAALEEIFGEARRRGLTISERASRPGWTIYSISR